MRKVLKQALLLVLGLVNFFVIFVFFRQYSRFTITVMENQGLQCLTWPYLGILGGNWWYLVVIGGT